MKKLLLLFTLSFLALQNISAQEITSAQLDQLNGEWEGALTYTDYSDDKSQYELKTKLIAAFKKGKGVLKYIYTEPNGKIVKGKQKMKLGKTAESFYLASDFAISSFEQSDAANSWKLMLQKEGTDNNKPAIIKQVIILNDNNFSITKMIRYKDQDGFIQRNKYAFSRK